MMRRRKSPEVKADKGSDNPNPSKKDPPAPEEEEVDRSFHKETTTKLSYTTAKWCILRLLASVYLVAFLGAWYQNRGLMGENGLQPASEWFDRLRSMHSSPWNGFFQHPTLFWWIPINDTTTDGTSLVGAFLSLLVLVGVDSWIILLLLWLLYFSIVTIAGGTSFYSYGWESQLLETGFLAVFLCGFRDLFTLPRKRRTEPSPIVLWLFRWLCFRISIGAGLIKTRGSSCWADKTCLWYHFETQPLPSPLSFVFHFLPRWMLTRAVDLDLLVQLYTSWFVLVQPLPRRAIPLPTTLNHILLQILRVGGFLQAGFMVNILLSGNFSMLNHLTIVPALACLDDACWPGWRQKQGVNGKETAPKTPKRTLRWLRPKFVVDVLLASVIGYLSRPVVANLLQWGGGHQQMNASFDPFRLVNTYGAFGSVGKGRYEPIVSVHNGKEWFELEFPCKPGNVQRRPCFCAPYHYRLDWNIWFIGFKPHQAYLRQREQWLFTLIHKILDPNLDKRPWLRLLDSTSNHRLSRIYESPLSSSSLSNKAPLMVKVDMYRYRMSASLWTILWKSLTTSNQSGDVVVWWNRTYEESLIPPVRFDHSKKSLVLVQQHDGL